MGLGFLKKKIVEKEEQLLPPPPPLPQGSNFTGDFEPITPNFKETSQFPDLSIPEIAMDIDEKITENLPSPQDHIISKNLPHLEHFESKNQKGPVFVSMNDYEKIELDINSIKNLLNDAENNITVLNEVVKSEEKLYKHWRSYLEGVEKKLVFVENIISEADEK